MYNTNKNNKAETKIESIQEHKDCKEDNTTIHNNRNMKTLDKEMLNNIRHMSSEDKMDIIIALNDLVGNLNLLINESENG